MGARARALGETRLNSTAFAARLVRLLDDGDKDSVVLMQKISTTPLFSVVIPTYQRNDLPERCLEKLAPGGPVRHGNAGNVEAE